MYSRVRVSLSSTSPRPSFQFFWECFNLAGDMAVIGLSSVYTSAGIWGKPSGPPVSSVCGACVGLSGSHGHCVHTGLVWLIAYGPFVAI